MTLADLLDPTRILVPLGTRSLREAVAALLTRLVEAGAIRDAARLLERVQEERGEDVVAMGDRAFLMHYRTDAVQDLAIAIGTSPSPILRELGEGEAQRARIVLVIVAPPRLAARYLQVVGAFARALSKPAVIDDIVAAPDAESLADLPALREYALPEQLTVRDIMTERPRTVTPDTPIRDAARDMVRAGIGALPVVEDDGLVVGLLSERELMRHLLSGYLQGGSTQRPTPAGSNARRSVRDVMTRQVICVSPEQPLAEIASLMINKDVERVPVVREGRLVGFLTRGDIVRKLIGW